MQEIDRELAEARHLADTPDARAIGKHLQALNVIWEALQSAKGTAAALEKEAKR